jgi:hypothetical protein
MALDGGSLDSVSMFGFALCVDCGQFFAFNPDHVPRAVGIWRGGRFIPPTITEQRPPEAVREPVCRACIERVNATRKPGEPTVTIRPGAYEPVEEL